LTNFSEYYKINVQNKLFVLYLIFFSYVQQLCVRQF